jgi:hypothetical protein
VVLNVLIAAFILFAGSMKVFFPPPQMAEMMAKFGLEDRVLLIGWGEIITAVLLVLPWTSSLGGLLASGLWGGIICINMAHNQNPTVVLGSVLLALTWVSCYLRGSLPLLWVPVSRSGAWTGLPHER